MAIQPTATEAHVACLRVCVMLTLSVTYQAYLGPAYVSRWPIVCVCDVPGTCFAHPMVATNSRSAKSDSVAISLYSSSARLVSGSAYTFSGSIPSSTDSTLLSKHRTRWQVTQETRTRWQVTQETRTRWQVTQDTRTAAPTAPCLNTAAREHGDTRTQETHGRDDMGDEDSRAQWQKDKMTRDTDEMTRETRTAASGDNQHEIMNSRWRETTSYHTRDHHTTTSEAHHTSISTLSENYPIKQPTNRKKLIIVVVQT